MELIKGFLYCHSEKKYMRISAFETFYVSQPNCSDKYWIMGTIGMMAYPLVDFCSMKEALDELPGFMKSLFEDEE